MKKLIMLGVVAGLAAVVAVVGFTSGASAQRANAAGGGGAGAQSGVVVNNDVHAATEYWTDERMKSAKPLTAVRTDAAPASFGSANLDFTRSRITPQSVNTAAPYKTTGKLFFVIPGQGNFVCSASTIAKRLILTAAHCMYSSGVGFHTDWLFVPAYDGTKASPKDRPFGTWSWSRGEVPIQWINSNGALPNNDDFGILVAPDQSFDGGATQSKLSSRSGLYATATGHLFDTHVTMLGYPCNFDSCSIMQRNDSSDHRSPPGSSGSTVYEYGSDMTGGSSGGPWIENFGIGAAPQGSGFLTRNTVVGVTSYVYNDAAVKVLGASQLNSNFTTIRTNSCNAAQGNC